MTDDYSFDGRGKLTSSTGSTANSQLYKGEYLAYRKDPDAGPELQYSTHHRNYNPQTGVFTAADPAKDDLNLYRYVKNNPVNKSDPSGLQDDGWKFGDDGHRTFWVNNQIVASRAISSIGVWNPSRAFGEKQLGVEADFVYRLIGSPLNGEASRTYRVPFQFFDQFVEQMGLATLDDWNEEQWDDWFRRHDVVNNPDATKPADTIQSEETSLPEPTPSPTDWTQHPGRGAEAEVLANPGFKEEQKFGDTDTALHAGGFREFDPDERERIIRALDTVESISVAAVDTAVGFIPGVGDFKDLVEAIRGKGTIDGEEISLFWRFASAFLVLVPFVSGSTLRKFVEFLNRIRQRIVQNLPEGAKQLLKRLDELDNAIRNQLDQKPSFAVGHNPENAPKPQLGDSSPPLAPDDKNALNVGSTADFDRFVAKNKGIYANLDSNGYVEYKINTKGSGVRGTDLFKEMMQHFGSNVKGIWGKWNAGDNLIEVNKLTATGIKLEDAVTKTWAANRARDAGFGTATIKKQEGSSGDYTNLEVLFTP